MQRDDNKSPAECGEKCGAPVDRTREHRCKDDDEHRIKRSLARQRTFMPEADHDQGGDKDDDSAQRYLKEGQIFRFNSEPEQRSDEIVERVHIEKKLALLGVNARMTSAR